MKFLSIQLIICIIFSVQENPIDFLGNIHKDDKIKLEDIQKALKVLNLENVVSNVSNLFHKNLFNLTYKINELINDTLYSKEQILKEEEEELFIKEILSEIDNLKKRYKKNKIFSYINGAVILITFILFYWKDHLNRSKRGRYRGLKNPASTDSENNQLVIE